MSAAKERRKAARAAKFSGHEPDAAYHPAPSATVTTGREYDAERTEKTPTSDVGTSSSPKVKTDETGDKRDGTQKAG